METKDIISSGLLELYATGLASEQESKQVLQLAEQYPEVAKELQEIFSGMDVYIRTNKLQPSTLVKEKIFARINEPGTEKAIVVPIGNTIAAIRSTKKTTAAFWKYTAAASIILLAGSVVLNMFLFIQNQNIQIALQSNYEATLALQEKASIMETDLQVLQSKYSQPVTLNGLESAPDAAAKIFWMKNTGEVFIDPSNLPEAPKGKQYQVWAIVDGKPVDAGIILTSKKGEKYRIQKMKSFGRAEAFAVSLETESELPNDAPKGPIMVMGKM